MTFTYSLTGWEGSASDAWIFESAININLEIPPGYYLLGDMGFPHWEGTMVPYQNTHYHLAEWGQAKIWYMFIYYIYNKIH
jgi:hypothetical protein